MGAPFNLYQLQQEMAGALGVAPENIMVCGHDDPYPQNGLFQTVVYEFMDSNLDTPNNRTILDGVMNNHVGVPPVVPNLVQPIYDAAKLQDITAFFAAWEAYLAPQVPNP